VPVVPVLEVRDVAGKALAQAGIPPANATIQLEILLEAELRGIPSHGLLRLDRIVQRIGNGVADPHTRGRFTWRSRSFLSIDGQMGLGPVVAKAALDAIQDRACETGVALAAVSNSNHIGMLGWYAENVAASGQILIALSTSEALVHPWGGRKALIGTNPIAIGVPAGDELFVMDTATSIVSMGEIHDHAHRGAPIPRHWALDANGNPTTDADEAKSGAIAPFGGAKGYSLGLAFELLVTGLCGSAIGRDVRGTLDATEVCNKGDLFIVIDGPQPHLSAYLDIIRNTEPADGFERVLVPGDRARACREKYLIEGLPIVDEVWERLQVLAKTPLLPQQHTAQRAHL
jgi:L-2-hydroxycarboxylate dehydrogenase (NAD+)